MKVTNAQLAAWGHAPNGRPKRGRKAKGKPPEFPPLPAGTRVIALDVSSRAAGVADVRINGHGPVMLGSLLVRPPAGWHVLARIDRIASEVAEWVLASGPELIVFEWAAPRNTDAHKRGLGYLYAAQYATRERLRSLCPTLPIETVRDSFWTARESKQHRARRVRAEFREYDPKGDPGSDVADAIALAVWRLTR